MNDYSLYDFSIAEKDLLNTLKEAKQHGFNALVVINGCYYNVIFEDEAAAMPSSSSNQGVFEDEYLNYQNSNVSLRPMQEKEPCV